MVNIEKHINYWAKGAEEDFSVAQELIARGRIRHGLFFMHLALEKMLKAHICSYTEELAPKKHDLLSLSRSSNISLTKEQELFLARSGRFQLEGRYPEMLDPPPTPDQAEKEIKKAGDLLSWLKMKLSG